MESFKLSDEKKYTILRWFWYTAFSLTLQDLENFNKMLMDYPKEINFVFECMTSENIASRSLIDFMNSENGINKIIEFARYEMRKISKTKTQMIMYAMQEKEVAMNINISSLKNYYADGIYWMLKEEPREKLLSYGFKSKKYPKR